MSRYIHVNFRSHCSTNPQVAQPTPSTGGSFSVRPKIGDNPLGTHIGLFLQMRAWRHSHTLQSIASPHSALSFFVVELWYHEMHGSISSDKRGSLPLTR